MSGAFVASPFSAPSAPSDVALGRSSATDRPQYIDVNGFHFDPLVGWPSIPINLTDAADSRGGGAYYIIQFHNPIDMELQRKSAGQGVRVLYYVHNNSIVSRLDAASLNRVKALPEARWVGSFQPAFKVSPRLLEALADFGGPPLPTDPTSRPIGEHLPSAVALPRGEIAGRIVESPTASGDETARRLVTVVIVPFEVSGLADVLRVTAQVGGSSITLSAAGSGIVRAEVDVGAITAIAREPNVMWIDLDPRPRTFNDIARWIIQSGNKGTFATPVHDRGILGTGQIVTVGDTGLDYQHDAFEDPDHAIPETGNRKVTAYYIPAGAGGDSSDNGINHGTHVSGTVAGDDGIWHVYNGDATGSNGTTGPHDGQAFDAILQVQDLSTDGFSINPPADLHTMYQEAAARGSSIHTNSWGSCCSDYIVEASQTDDFIWNNPDFIVLYAAGNSGSGPYSLNPFAAAKNVLAVGATENGANLQNVAYFSSRGPTRDGRLKPDIMAPGVGVWSAHGCDPGSQCDDYAQLSGTSMATPTVAGAAALVRQYFMDGWYPTGSKQAANGFVPSAAMVKAVLINSGAEMNGAGAYENGETRYPNFSQGWGRVLLDDGLFFDGDSRGLTVDDHRTGMNSGDLVSYQLAIGDTSLPVEISLVWSDYPAAPFSSPNLVNDLDLVVSAPDGTVYYGNQYVGYNPGESKRNPTDADRLNNVESVLVRTGIQAGVWTVQVRGFNVPMGPQPYAIAMTGGISKEKGVVQMERNTYRSSAVVNVTVVDFGPNVNPNAPDTAKVNMSSTTETLPELITLTETGKSTSIFTGSMQLQNGGVPVSDGILQVRDKDTITAMYYDVNDGQGGSGPTYDTATVDDVPPIISGIGAVNVRWFRATIAWTTDERADSVLDWGSNAPPTERKSDPSRVTSHSFTLSGLAPSTTYYFAVQSTDEAGNTARADNGSSYYRFTTPAKPPDAPASPEWPQFHHGQERGGVSPVPFEMPLSPRWNTTIGGSRIHWSGPVIDNHTVFFTEREGTVTALDLGTGALKWQVPLGAFGYVHGTPTVTSGTVYVALVTNGGNYVTLFALRENDGSVKWKSQSPVSSAAAFTTPAVDADRVYWNDGPAKKLRANDAQTGAAIWTFTMPDKGFQGPTYWAGIVFATDGIGNVIAVDGSAGTELWRANVGASITSAPTIANGVLYLGDYSGTVNAIDPLTGTRLWTSARLGRLIDLSTPVVVNGRVFVGAFAEESGAGRMYALDASSGATLWSYFMPRGPVGASAAYNNGTVFLASWDGNLYAWNASTGALLQQVVLSPAGSTSSVAIGDGYLVVGDESGRLSAFSFVGAGEARRIQAVPGTVDLAVGSAVLFEADALDAYDNLVPGPSFTWTSIAGLGTILPATDTGDRAVYVAGTVTGTDTVLVQDSQFAGTAVVHISPGIADHVELNPPSTSVVVGRTFQFSAAATDRFGNTVPGSTFIWTVTGAIGTIDSTGLFTASTTAGVGTITVENGLGEATAAVRVIPSTLSTILIAPSSISLVAGSSAVLSGIAEDAYGNPIADATINWSASQGTLLPLDAQGTLALYAAPTLIAGPATIVASCGGVSASLVVSLLPAPFTRLSILPPNPGVGAGGTILLTANAYDLYGNQATGVSATWSSSAGTISADGSLIAPTRSGFLVVTAVWESLEAESVVEVTPGGVDVVVASPTSVSLTTGSRANLVVVAMDLFGNEIEDATFSWSTTIGTLERSSDGRSTILLAGDKTGLGTVTVASGGKSDTVDVAVTAAVPQPGWLESQTTSITFLVVALVLATVVTILAVKVRRLRRAVRRAERRMDSRASQRGGPLREDAEEDV